MTTPSLLLGFAQAKQSQSFRYLNCANKLSQKVMKYLLATCGADQQHSKKSTDLGNSVKDLFYNWRGWSNS